MIEINNPAINADEIMEKIRNEVAKRRKEEQNPSVHSENKASEAVLHQDNRIISHMEKKQPRRTIKGLWQW